MAKKEQCTLCRGYNPTKDLCTIKWIQPSFDENNCNEFKDKQSLERTETNIETEDGKVTGEEEITQVANCSVNNRDTSNVNESLLVKGEKGNEDKGDNTDESKFVIDLPENVFLAILRILRLLRILLVIVVIISAIYGVYVFVKYQERQDREEVVWKARMELEAIRDAKIIEYLKLYKIDYNENLLTLYFLRNYSKYNVNNQVTDSVISKEILSLVAIDPYRWDSICCYLNKAEVDLKIVYSDFEKEPSISIHYSDLSNKLLSEEAKKEGLMLFASLKGNEVLGYALKHFKSDWFFKVEGIELDNENIYLNLSYNDNKAKLGKTFLDTTEVNMHFRDPVGEMGSILDGMLSICTRTNRGFGFTFKGQKNHRIDSVMWPVEKMRKIAEKNRSIPTESRKTNQVKTIITRTKSKK